MPALLPRRTQHARAELWCWSSRRGLLFSERISLWAFWSLRRSDRTCLSHTHCLVDTYSLSLQFFLEVLEHILPLNFLNFLGSILLDELLYTYVAATNSHQYLLAPLDFYVDPSLTELIDALRLTQEHDSHFLALWVFVDEVAQGHVDLAGSLGYVNALSVFHLTHQILHLLDLLL